MTVVDSFIVFIKYYANSKTFKWSLYLLFYILFIYNLNQLKHFINTFLFPLYILNNWNYFKYIEYYFCILFNILFLIF